MADGAPRSATGAALAAPVALRAAPLRIWAPALAALAAGLLALGALFHAEALAAVKVWSDSTAFGHCFLVLPIAAWLGWERRGRLAALSPQPMPAVALLALPLTTLWFAAERLGVMEWRQFAALFLVWLLTLAVLGWRLSRAMAVPLAYLLFLVPFGAFLVPLLQDFTARFVDAGLAALAIPHVVTAMLIEIPEGNFQVAEACAGLRFLIAAIAFGVLYACVIYRSPWRRAAFIAVCVVAPILANGVRALGIVLLGHWKGSAEAGAVDHVLYGWIFFSIVILLLVLLGLPFQQSFTFGVGPRPAARRAPGVLALVTAVAAVAVLAASGPAGAAWLDGRVPDQAAMAAQAGRLAQALVAPPGCEALPPATGVRRFACGGVVLQATVQVLPVQAGPAVLRTWREATDIGEAEEAEASWLDLPQARWRIMTAHGPDRMAAAVLWLGGVPAADGLALRLRLAEASLGLGGPTAGRAIVLALAAPVFGPKAAALVSRFSAAQADGVGLF